MEMFLGCNLWRSQPDNLVPLCKFQIIIAIHFVRNCCFTVNEHENICMAGLNLRAGCDWSNFSALTLNKLRKITMQAICNHIDPYTSLDKTIKYGG